LATRCCCRADVRALGIQGCLAPHRR
jgi:hypothetical protein